MSKALYLLLTVMLGAFMLTCDDSGSDKKSAFAGTWELEFDGAFFGPAFIKIGGDGSVNENNLVLAATADCTNLFSNTITADVMNDGSVVNGIIINNSSKNEVGSFTGTLTGTTGSGTYEVLSDDGTWTAIKE